MDATHREIVDWMNEVDRVRGLLQLSRTAFPAPSTLYRSFERVPMSIWRGFLQESAKICDPGSHGAIDATFFDRESASRHYPNRSDRHIRTLKTRALVGTDSCAILDIRCSAHYPHDTQTGHQVALRNTEKSRVSPVTKAMATNLFGTPTVQRASGACFVTGCLLPTITHTSTIGQRTIRQRWMAETAFSAIKRRFGPANHPRAWYRGFRELVVTATVYNLKQALKK